MDTHLLAIQARILLWTGMGILVACLWLGIGPYTAAWRAAVGAVVAMWCGRWLLDQVAAVIEERAAIDLAERDAAEVGATAEAEDPAPVNNPQARRSPAAPPRPAGGR